MNSSKRILVVEDDILQNKFITSVLDSFNSSWEIISAYSYEEAMLLINEASQQFVLFLLDVQLSSQKGDRGGFVLAEKIRSIPSYYQTPILFLTAISSEVTYALSHFHCYNYISKPYTGSDLIHQLEQMVISGYLDDSIQITDISRITHMVSPKDLLYIEISNHVLKIHSVNDVILTRQYSLDTILAILPTYFYRCHKKYIVNSKAITNTDKTRRLIHIFNTPIPINDFFIENNL